MLQERLYFDHAPAIAEFATIAVKIYTFLTTKIFCFIDNRPRSPQLHQLEQTFVVNRNFHEKFINHFFTVEEKILLICKYGCEVYIFIIFLSNVSLNCATNSKYVVLNQMIRFLRPQVINVKYVNTTVFFYFLYTSRSNAKR